MNERLYEIKTLLNVPAATQAQTGSVVAMAPSASVAKREMKLITISNGNTYATATQCSFPIVVEECDTTNGTFTAVGGDTPPTIGTAGGVVESHIRVSKAQVRARIGTIGTGGTSANIAVLLMNLKREA